MKYVIAAVVAGAFVFMAATSWALTLKPGEVISGDTGEVTKASETSTGKANLEENGVLVSGGIVFISVGDHQVEVPLNELVGKSKDQIKEILGEELTEQLEDLHGDAVDHAAEIVESGAVENAVVAVGKTTEQILEELDLDAATGAVVGITEAQNRDLCDQMGDCVHPEDIGNEPN